ncbi:MAG: hypothetical protein BWY88_00571 [Synergistetes bacterium ADurb.Bin520]|nr:MAG: hypothetical protein BWY88_00571 [Synergistetes bacterium ADurb.Bin520]
MSIRSRMATRGAVITDEGTATVHSGESVRKTNTWRAALPSPSEKDSTSPGAILALQGSRAAHREEDPSGEAPFPSSRPWASKTRTSLPSPMCDSRRNCSKGVNETPAKTTTCSSGVLPFTERYPPKKGSPWISVGPKKLSPRASAGVAGLSSSKGVPIRDCPEASLIDVETRTNATAPSAEAGCNREKHPPMRAAHSSGRALFPVIFTRLPVERERGVSTHLPIVTVNRLGMRRPPATVPALTSRFVAQAVRRSFRVFSVAWARLVTAPCPWVTELSRSRSRAVR